jgi:hypothetical protein
MKIISIKNKFRNNKNIKKKICTGFILELKYYYPFRP